MSTRMIFLTALLLLALISSGCVAYAPYRYDGYGGYHGYDNYHSYPYHDYDYGYPYGHRW